MCGKLKRKKKKKKDLNIRGMKDVRYNSMENIFSIRRLIEAFTERGNIIISHANHMEVSAFYVEAIVIFFLTDRLAPLCLLHPHFSR